MKKMMQRIRAAKTGRDRGKIAEDTLPGTPYDSLFHYARLAQEHKTKNLPFARDCIAKLGNWLAAIIVNNDIPELHNLATALALLKHHKPKRNYDLEALFTMHGMFPPGWLEKSVVKDEAGQLICDPATGRPIIVAKPGHKIAMRDLKQNIKRIDPDFDEDKWEHRRRNIQRYAKEFKIPLDDTPGRPPKETRQDSAEKG